MIKMANTLLIILALAGVILVLLSMYVIPYIEKYRGMELHFFLSGVIVILGSLFLIKIFYKP
ncbi:hypothetical protein GUT184_16960 [Streptococcus ruminantium]|nr:hypothetical protein BZG42_08990 [Streptococcus sp. DAT741]BDD41432.1 hypothetical protein GUT184_16960 [Streptococcus ruminantium]